MPSISDRAPSSCLIFPIQWIVVAAISLAIGSAQLGCNSPSQSSNSGSEKQAANGSKTKRDSLIFEDTEPFKVDYIAKKIDRTRFDEADLKILFVGNSHTRDSPEQLGTLFALLKPEKKVLIARSVGGFLAEHAESKTTLDLIQLGKWDYVVLQAQKYSTSGKYSYPTDGAEKLAAEANKQGAKVILFPEWSRRDFPGEHLRVDKIHQAIAKKTNDSVVAPIGETWVAVAENHPELDLLHPDGNHASQSGNFVNACIFYSMIEKEFASIPVKNDNASDSNRKLEVKIADAVKHALGKKER